MNVLEIERDAHQVPPKDPAYQEIESKKHVGRVVITEEMHWTNRSGVTHWKGFMNVLGRSGSLTRRHSMKTKIAESKAPDTSIPMIMGEVHGSRDPPCDTGIYEIPIVCQFLDRSPNK
jgi:hypothetical protein